MTTFCLSGRVRGHFLATVFAFAGFVLPISQASAQQNEDSGTEQIEEIIVTGSRLARRDENAPSPIVTVGAQYLEDTGSLNVEEALNELPQFTRDSSGGQGTGGRALLDLRGLGANRNLILLDGRRLPISSSSGVVDTNIIPPNIVNNVEIITGGASAVYGSDAVSGVVNFLTPSTFDGVQVDMQYGNSTEGDFQGVTGSIIAGGSFDDDRGQALISFAYTDQDPLWGKDRAEFYALGIPSSYIGQGTYVPSAANRPDQGVLDTLFAGYGVQTVPNNNNLGFNDNGSLFSQTGAVNYLGPIDLSYQVIGGNVRMPVLVQGTARPSVVRRNVFSKLSYEVAPGVTAYGQFLFTDHTTNTNSGGTLTQFGTPTIPVTNPFIPADLATLLASRADPNEPFGYNSRYVMLPAKNWDENYITQQYLGGLKGEFGANDWTWDVYAAYDDSRHNQQQNYAVFLSRVQTLFNAPDGGDSICAGGYNPFGLANVMSMSQECKDYISGETHSVEVLTRKAAEAVVRGSLFELPAGDVRAAFTANYRKDEYSFSPDKALAEQDVQAVIAVSGSEGSINVTELSAEFDIPILDSLSLGAAYRYSDYNLSGGTNTYKLDAIWRPTDSILVRGGIQHAIRAPNINELYSAATGGQVGFGNPPAGGEPCDIRSAARINDTSGQLRQLCIDMGVPAAIVDNYIFPTTATASLSSGNVGLNPEEADTLTLGVVFNTELGGGDLFLSLDYFDIEIKDVVSVIPGATALNKCHNLDGSNPTYSTQNVYCQLITRDVNGFLDLIRTPYLNLGKLATNGLDVQANWSQEFGFGTLSLDSVITWVDSYKIQTLPGDATVDEAGTIGFFAVPRPEIRAQTNFGFARDVYSVSLRWRYIDSMKDRSTLTNPSSTVPGVSSYSKFDLVGRYDITDNIQVRAGITNLADKDPLVVAGAPGITDNETYDIVGRSYYLGTTIGF